MNYWPMNAICSHLFTQCKHCKFISENHNILFIARKYRIHTFFSLAVRNEKWRIDQREKINVTQHHSTASLRIYSSQTVGFEPTLQEGNWFQVSRLNHSATSAYYPRPTTPTSKIITGLSSTYYMLSFLPSVKI